MFIRKKNAIALIQQKWRAYIQRQNLRREREARNKAAVTVQKTWKTYKTCKIYASTKRAAVTIQSCVRRYQQQRRYQTLQRAAVVIQRKWRATMQACQQREQFLRSRQAAICIQKYMRGRRARQEVMLTQRKVVLVQRAVRQFLARRVLKRKITEKREQVRVYNTLSCIQGCQQVLE